MERWRDTSDKKLPALTWKNACENAAETFLRAANLTIPVKLQPLIRVSESEEMDALPFKRNGNSASEKLHRSLTHEKSDSPPSARPSFSSLCLHVQLPPSLRLILRKMVSSELNISHMSIGDDLACDLAASLTNLPLLTSLNVQDNRLHEKGLQAILQAAQMRKDLFSLNLSQNKYERQAAKAMAVYLKSESCALRTLVLSRSEVDDDGLVLLAKALQSNTSLASLDLSYNKIGSNEMLNTIRPNEITGGEAIATMLTLNTTLTYLDVSWNYLKDSTATEIGSVLRYNNGLRELNLSYNAFGNAGTQAIAEALLTNRTLEALDLGHNNVPYEAGLALASALKGNTSLVRLILDGNPLGSIAGRSLLHAIAAVKERHLFVSMENCNFDLSTPSSFDPMDPTGTYDLDLTIPYERAIARELLQIANTRKGCKFLSLEHRTSTFSKKIHVALQEVESSSDGIDGTFLETSMLRKENSFIERLFEELDVEKCGYLDVHGLKKGLQQIRVHATDEELFHYFAYYDLDGSEKIELLEFVDFMHSFHVKPNENAVRKYCVVDKETKEPLTIPYEGHAAIKFLDLHVSHENDSIYSIQGIDNMLDAIGSSSYKATQLQLARTGLYFELEQVQRLAHSLKDSLDSVQIVTLLLPHLREPKSAYAFLSSQIRDSSMRLAVQKELTPLFGVLFGLCTRHYHLDLSKELHRNTLQKLIAMSARIATNRKAMKWKDTSQHGNFHGFRNEMLNGKSIVLTPQFFKNVPKFGLLEFDFVQMERNSRRAMSNKTFEGLLQRLRSHNEEVAGSKDNRSRSVGNEEANILKLLRSCSFSVKVYRALDTMHLSNDSSYYSQYDSPRKRSDPMFENNRMKASHLLYELEWSLVNRHVTCWQAIELFQSWPLELQSSKIDAVCMLFDRIVDLHYFLGVMSVLTHTQAAQCLFRLGWLNLWTPLVPDNYYELCLSRYEEREMAKILVRLAMDEPGENWKRQSFGWTLHETISGWELNLSWLQGSNIPRRGYLKLQYALVLHKNCRINWPSRMKLASATLCGIPYNIQHIQAIVNVFCHDNLRKEER